LVPEREHEKWLLHLRVAAGAKIAQYRLCEAVTKNNNRNVNIGDSNWNENKIKFLTRNKKRASLVPAAAVIPALLAYINIAAVKTLVVLLIRVGGRGLQFSLFTLSAGSIKIVWIVFN